MALVGKLSKFNKNNIFRFDFENAYFMIKDEILIDSRKEGHAVVVIAGYADEYSRHNYGSIIYKRAIFIPYESFSNISVFSKDTLKKKAYGYLKTQSGFDCLKDHLSEYTGSRDFTKYCNKNTEEPDMLNISSKIENI